MFNIILKRFITNINAAMTRFETKMINDKIINISTFQKILLIRRSKVLVYLFIIFIFYIFFKNVNISLSIIFWMLISVIVIGFLIQKDHNDEVNFIKSKEQQLKFLHDLMFSNDQWYRSIYKQNFIIKPEPGESYLHLNPLLVEFFYNTKEYSQYCITNYIISLFHCNNIVGLLEDSKIGLKNPFQNLTVAQREYKLALNNYESIIHSLPQVNKDSSEGNKFIKAIHILQSILLNMIEKIINNCEEYTSKVGYNIHTIPNNMLEKFKIIQGNDTELMDYMPNFDYF